jgi:electron transfer flavoprotein alpha subunit
MAANYWIYAEITGSAFRKTTFELLGLACSLSGKSGGETTAIVLGQIDEDSLAKLGKAGANKVLYCNEEIVTEYSTEGYATIIANLAKAQKPTAIFFPATARGKDLAPRLAAKLAVGMASDCTALTLSDNQRIIFTRPMFAGKIIAKVECTGAPQIATIRPNAFPYPSLDDSKKAEIVKINAGITPDVIRTRIVETVAGDAEVNLTDAGIIVSGGRGMRDGANFAIIRELAKALGAAVGASRAAVDAGWIPQAHQVGQTGKTVSPNLYIACGISGSIQHRAGMSTAKCIVAINTNPEADIFKIADLGIVADLFQVVPALTEELKK